MTQDKDTVVLAILESLKAYMEPHAKATADLKTLIQEQATVHTEQLKTLQSSVVAFEISMRFNSERTQQHDTRLVNVENKVHTLELDGVQQRTLTKDIERNELDVVRLTKEVKGLTDTTFGSATSSKWHEWFIKMAMAAAVALLARFVYAST